MGISWWAKSHAHLTVPLLQEAARRLQETIEQREAQIRQQRQDLDARAQTIADLKADMAKLVCRASLFVGRGLERV